MLVIWCVAGKMETRTQKQCKDYIRPLFKLCKKEEVPLDILDKLLRVRGGGGDLYLIYSLAYVCRYVPM